MAQVTIDFTTRGARVAIAELDRLRAAAQSSTQATTALARSLNTSFSGAQRFSRNIGLTADAANAAVTRIRELNSVGANAAQRFNAVNSELGITRQQFLQLDRAAAVTARGLGTVATAAGAVSVAIGTQFTRGVQAFTQFDSAIRQTGAISGASEEQIQALREEIQRLGIETSKAPAEIASTSIALSRAGFSAEQAGDALQGVVAASEATGESLEITGDIIARTLRTFGLAADESDRLANVLTATANSTNSTVASIGESLNFVGATAAAANQPVEDIAIAIGLLGDAGIQGSSAGTNLAQAIERLRQASAGAESEFTQLVRGNQRAVEAFELIGANVRDANDQLLPLTEILPQVRAGLAGLSQQDQDLVFKALFGTQGGRAFQTLLNATPERIDEVTQSVVNSGNAAEETSQQLLQGLGGAFSLLEGSIGATSAEFGAFVAGPLEVFVRSATTLLNSFLSLPAPIRATLIATTALTGVYTAAIAAVTAYNLANGAVVVTEARKAAALVASTTAQITNTAVTNALAAAKALLAGNVARAAAAFGLSTSAVAANAAAYGVLAAQLAAFAVVLAGIRSGFNQLAIAAGNTEEVERLEEAFSQLNQEIDETASSSVNAANSLSEAFGRVADAEGIFDRVTAAVIEIGAALNQGADSADRFGGAFGLATLEQRRTQQEQIALTDGIAGLNDGYQEAIESLNGFEAALAASGSQSEESQAQVQAYTIRLAESITTLEQQIDALEAAKGADEEFNAQLEAEIQIRQRLLANAQDRIAQLRDESSAADDAVRSVLSFKDALEELEQTSGIASQESALQLVQREAQIANDLARGAISENESAVARSQATQDALNAQIEQARVRVDELNRIQAEGQAGTETEQRQLDSALLDAEQDLANAQKELSEEVLAQQQADQRARVEANEAAIAQVEATNRRASTERQRQILEETQRLQQAGLDEVEIAERTAEARSDAERQALEEQIALAQERLRLATNDAEAEEARLDVAELENDLIQNSIDRERELQAITERRIEAELEGIQEAADLEQRKADIQAEGIGLVERSLQRQQTLLQEQQNILQVAADIQSSLSSREEDRLQRALEIQRQLNDEEEETTEQRLALERELEALGIGRRTTERQLQRQLLQEARSAADQEIASLQRRQEIERLSLEAQIQQNQLADQRALIEARIAEIQTQAQLNQARAAGDAETVRLLEEQLRLNRQNIALSQEQIATNEASAAQQRAALDLSQAGQRSQLLDDLADEATELSVTLDDASIQSSAQSFASLLKTQADIAAEQAAALAANAIAQSDAQVAELKQAQRDLDISASQTQAGILNQAAAVRNQAAIATAQQVAGILSGAGGAVPSARSGGVATGGLMQLHRDEFLIPPRGTRIVSQAESRQLVRESIRPAPTSRALTQNLVLERRVAKLTSIASEQSKYLRRIASQQLGQANTFNLADTNEAARMAADMRRLGYSLRKG